MRSFIVMTFIIWRLALLLFVWLASFVIMEKTLFLGPNRLANFDGIHYLSIAESNYHITQHAFFPLYPLLINYFAPLFKGVYLTSALVISHAAFFIALLVMWKLIKIDYHKNEVAVGAIIFLLLFPTSFYFGAVYTESLFLMLILGSFYAARKGRWWITGVLGFLAATTRLVGVFLLPALLWEWWEQNKFRVQSSEFRVQIGELLSLMLIPLGLLWYMGYLKSTVGDPLAFIHEQPAFGANRSGGEIILLPQVVIRYIKIFLSVPLTSYDLWIAILEFATFTFSLGLIVFSFGKIRKSYLIFAFLAILIPTLSGTLSSMPRYVLAAFPIFIMLGSLKNKLIKYLLLSISLALLIILVSLFSQGYFVA